MEYIFSMYTVTFFLSFCKHTDDGTKEQEHVSYCT